MTPYTVEVSRDVFMLPALVDPADPGVEALQRSHLASCGEEAPPHYSQGAFDCGGIIARGVPAVITARVEEKGCLAPILCPFAPLRTRPACWRT